MLMREATGFKFVLHFRYITLIIPIPIRYSSFNGA